jgi:hypothetical protein
VLWRVFYDVVGYIHEEERKENIFYNMHYRKKGVAGILLLVPTQMLPEFVTNRIATTVFLERNIQNIKRNANRNIKKMREKREKKETRRNRQQQCREEVVQIRRRNGDIVEDFPCELRMVWMQRNQLTEGSL